MHTYPSPAAPARSLAEVNADIRALWRRSGGHLSPEGHREYERLLTEWSVVIRAEQDGAEQYR
ncbi:hypothetical protein [uncultured Streptomyces sp.]|uniref:hypothetical protein n=1 Tax=uncultured Streptomyces sp. TaxID=174707 RepID=UPI002626BD54|nr:hypothetical protein [uncultured Streptomyces sp.]